MKCLLTGASGFIGIHLARHLKGRGHEVWATSRRGQPSESDGIHRLQGDVVSEPDVAAWLAMARPDVVVHLAAQSLPGVSWQSPSSTFETNVNGTMNVLCGLREARSTARFVMVSSSSVYAPPQGHTLLTEADLLGGSSPYAWSKLAAEQGALLYGRHTGMDVVSVRPFFIIGPSKTGDVTSDFARRIVAAERGGSRAITVGNLDITRDFLDVEDAVRGFEAIIEHGSSGQSYNICSGQPVTIRSLLDTVKSLAMCDITETLDTSLLRPIDEPVKVGDPTRLRDLGWTAEVSLEDSIRRILDHWRKA